MLAFQQELIPFLGRYGYGVICLVIGLESMGLPLPGESLLLAAALYAAATGHLDIGLVVLAAVIGAILGDNAGYLVGRRFGTKLLLRHGGRVGLTGRRILIGRYLFRHYGKEVVFFGRFIAVLRTFSAVLAGTNQMPWHSFLVFNALGGLVWAGAYGYGGYAFGNVVLRLRGPVELWLGLAALAGLAVGLIFLKRYEGRLEEKAEREAMAERSLSHE